MLEFPFVQMGLLVLQDDDSRLPHARVADACTRLLRRMTVQQPVELEDFNRDYSDGKFWRFLLYLMVHRNEAHDWDKAGARLGFDGAELLTDFRPQWHHIFPQKFLAKKVESPKIDALANIAVIGPDINIRISAQDPMKYLDKYVVTDEKLAEQFIVWKRADFSLEKFDDFLANRTDRLRTAANDFLLDLSKRLPDDCRPNKGMAAGANGAGK